MAKWPENAVSEMLGDIAYFQRPKRIVLFEREGTPMVVINTMGSHLNDLLYANPHTVLDIKF